MMGQEALAWEVLTQMACASVGGVAADGGAGRAGVGGVVADGGAGHAGLGGVVADSLFQSQIPYSSRRL
jgi:hypothetical protein